MQPPAYDRTKDFTEDFGSETDHSSLNAELDAASNSINDIRDNLAILQADDGKLRAGVVTVDSISTELRNDLINGASEGALDASVVATNAAAAAEASATQSGAHASAAGNSATAAGNSAIDAQDAATAAATSVASVSLPSIVGKALNWLRAKVDESGYEFRTPAQLRADVGAAASGANGDITALTALSSINGGPLAGMRNKIINGNFDIWQRGTSQTTNGFGSDDRWDNSHSISTKTHSRQAFALGQADVPGNPKYFSRTVVSSVAGAGSFVLKRHKLEGVHQFAGGKATVSFYAKADANRPIAIEFDQNFGSGGSPSARVSGIGAQKLNLTTAWQRFAVTVDISSIAGKTLGTNGDDHLVFGFWFDAGSDFNARTDTLGQQSGTFDIAQVQLEEGTVATPFEQRPYGLELSLCQRYLVVFGGAGNFERFGPLMVNNSTTAYATIALPQQLRASPTLNVSALADLAIFSAAGVTAASSVGVDAASNKCVTLSIGGTGLTAGQAGQLIANNTLSARLMLSAEL